MKSLKQTPFGTLITVGKSMHMDKADLRDVVFHGECQTATSRHMGNEVVQLTFTSPPYYNARDYAAYGSYNEYLSFLEDIFSRVMRVTESGRFLVVNTSPVIEQRASRQTESRRYAIPFDLHAVLRGIGWEFIDDIVWEKPEASVPGRNNGFFQHRRPLAYKPNAITEYLMVYRKPSGELIDHNIHGYSQEVINASLVGDGYETSNIWRVAPERDAVHSAVFPVELAKRVIRYYSLKGDLVFDPFGGRGTTAVAALAEERHFCLMERKKEYVERMTQYIGGMFIRNIIDVEEIVNNE
jgi:DNA modification methylase